jgi:hypothetical protein
MGGGGSESIDGLKSCDEGTKNCWNLKGKRE